LAIQWESDSIKIHRTDRAKPPASGRRQRLKAASTNNEVEVASRVGNPEISLLCRKVLRVQYLKKWYSFYFRQKAGAKLCRQKTPEGKQHLPQEQQETFEDTAQDHLAVLLYLRQNRLAAGTVFDETNKKAVEDGTVSETRFTSKRRAGDSIQKKCKVSSVTQ